MKKVLIILGVLAVLLFVLITLQNGKDEAENIGLTLINGNDSIFVSLKTLKTMSINIVEIDDKKVKLIKFDDLLKKIEFESSEWHEMNFLSSDGAKVNISRDKTTELYLHVIENGNSYLRLVIPESAYRQNWLKYVVKVEFK